MKIDTMLLVVRQKLIEMGFTIPYPTYKYISLCQPSPQYYLEVVDGQIRIFDTNWDLKATFDLADPKAFVEVRDFVVGPNAGRLKHTVIAHFDFKQTMNDQLPLQSS